MSDKYPNSGALFKNERKTEDRHPDYNGSLESTCPHCNHETHWWLSAWLKKSKKGSTFMSVSLRQKLEDKHENAAKDKPHPEEPVAIPF